MTKYDWQVSPLKVTPQVQQLAQTGHLKLGLAAILNQRGFDTSAKIKTLLQPSLTQLRDPFLLHDMQKAMDRIYQAIDKQELITVYGDYDADGITSTTIMYETLRILGANVNYYIPNRFIDGYGPNPKRFTQLVYDGTQLFITVDNGIVACDSIDTANRLGADVIITDHHEMGPKLPNAYAIVYAPYPGHEYPFDDFCGAGIAFKISCALLHTIPMELIGLAAIGTIADLVSLTDENRVIVKFGLQHLSQTTRPGLKMLLTTLGYDLKPITEEDIGFTIAPRFNALGRLGDAQLGVQLLTCLDMPTAVQLANRCEIENTKRKTVQNQIIEEATKLAEAKIKQGYHALIIAGHNWHQGVLGIVASAIVEQFNCPAIVVTRIGDKTVYRGSGRSIEGFDLFNALTDYRTHMVNFGGHAMACGLSVEENELDNLQNHFEQGYLAQVQGQSLRPQLAVTVKVRPAKLTASFYQDLLQLAPFGTNNPRPVVEVSDAEIQNAAMIGHDRQTLKCELVRPGGNLSAIMFHAGDALAEFTSGRLLNLCGSLSWNYWQGKRTLQFQIEDYQVVE